MLITRKITRKIRAIKLLFVVTRQVLPIDYDCHLGGLYNYTNMCISANCNCARCRQRNAIATRGNDYGDTVCIIITRGVAQTVTAHVLRESK